MANTALADQIDLVRQQLTSIDAQLARSGGSAQGLEDLKGAVDNLRTSVWAILTASRTGNYPGFIARFRLRRGIDILKHILADLESEVGGKLLPEHSEMQIMIQQVTERIGRVRGN